MDVYAITIIGGAARQKPQPDPDAVPESFDKPTADESGSAGDDDGLDCVTHYATIGRTVARQETRAVNSIARTVMINSATYTIVRYGKFI